MAVVAEARGQGRVVYARGSGGVARRAVPVLAVLSALACGGDPSSGSGGAGGAAGSPVADASPDRAGAGGAAGTGGAAGAGASAGAGGSGGDGGVAGATVDGGTSGAAGVAGTSAAGAAGAAGGGAPDAGSVACVAGGPRAFPGAEGFGACETTGGRGGAVVRVTQLGASGPGSLQDALDRRGPRTIVFDVSGVIDGVPVLTEGDVTVAGQTSPGGVILRGLHVQGDEVCEQEGCPLPTRSENVIVRFLRLRPALATDDGLRLHRARRVVIDHVSIANAEDEAVQISMTSDLTIQRSMFAETLGGHAEY